MSWYKAGTATFTNNSVNVTGSGVDWVKNAQVGDGVIAPDFHIYEIVAIPSATAITLDKVYGGITAAAAPYAIIPTQDRVRELTAAVVQLIADYALALSNSAYGIQNANKVFAGPVSGNSATPGFRALVLKDLPSGVAALVDAATIAVDASLKDSFRVTLDGNRTLENPTNLRSGQVLNFRITQGTGGSKTLAYGSMYKFAGGTAPVLSTTAGKKDFMSCQYDETDGTLFCVLNKAFA